MFAKYFNSIYFSIFKNLARYFDTRLEYIPITFILGFFVDTILLRWSNIFVNMGYIESSVVSHPILKLFKNCSFISFIDKH